MGHRALFNRRRQARQQVRSTLAIVYRILRVERVPVHRFVFTSTTRLPTSRILEKARAETFKGAWPHDNIKGHSANSKKVRLVHRALVFFLEWCFRTE